MMTKIAFKEHYSAVRFDGHNYIEFAHHLDSIQFPLEELQWLRECLALRG